MKDRNALIGTIVGCTATLLAAIGGMWISTNNRIDAVELRLREEIHSEIGRLDDRVGSFEIRITTRLDRLEDQVDETNERLSRIDERLSRMEGFLQRELEFVRGGDEE